MRTILACVSMLLMATFCAVPAFSGRAEPLPSRAASLLKAKCLDCHGAEKRGELDLRTRTAALKGGKHGPALVPGKSAASLLYKVIAGHAQPSMPLGGKLSQPEIALLKDWIDAGAKFPVQSSRLNVEGSRSDQPSTLNLQPATHWSFAPPKRPAIPAVKDRAWVRNPVDAFVLAKLEAEGLRASPPADRLTLLRRVTFDLTGLPPTPEEIRSFAADRAPDAYEKVVRRLLASPRYGERWAQHWLDVVRFAETNGFELDADRPQAWRYRDYVVKSFNEDKPYHRFVTEQLAGELLAKDDFELRVATGFLRAGPRHVVGGNVDEAVDRQEWLTEAVQGVGSAIMGLTIGCARCHDHKYDPIPQADYYRLSAFFAATNNLDYKPDRPDEQKAYEAAVLAHKARLKPFQDQIAEIEKPYRARLREEKRKALDAEYAQALAVDEKERTAEQKRLAAEGLRMLNLSWDEVVAVLTPADRDRRAALRRKMHELEYEAPEPLPMAPAAADVITPVPATHVLIRGEAHVRGAEVQPGFPTAVASAVSPAGASAGDRRLALTQWLTRPDNPLTARVIVNRLWQRHFGRGIVATPNDFGKNGQRPTHPELLDWLAVTLGEGDKGTEGQRDRGMEIGRIPKSLHPTVSLSPPNQAAWSLKKMHWLLVTSSAYRQSSTPASARPNAQRPTPNALDPDNRLFSRQNRWRLDGEALRDAVLQAAGTLQLDLGGPPIRVPLEQEVYDQIFTEGEPDNLWPVTRDPKQHGRRSLYLLRKRNVRLPMLAVFDQPDMMSSCAARFESVHALQSLTLMNSAFMQQQSEAFARRLLSGGREPGAGGRGEQERIGRLYLLALGRAPSPKELAATERFLREQTALIRERADRGEPIVKLAGLPDGTDPFAAAAWVDLCLAVFNLNEFAYVK